MSKTSSDLSNFLASIDAISEKLEAPRRSQDNNAPDCSVRELSALQAVSKLGRINMSTLSTTINVPISTATRIIDQLIDKGLLIRQPSTEDARRVEIDFSKLGQDINTYIIDTRQTYAQSMLSKLSDSDRSIFLELLSRLLEPPQ